MRLGSIMFSIFVLSVPVFAQPTPTADELAHRTFDVLAGDGAWERARFFSYTFTLIGDGQVVSQFPQKWDRVTGDYQVSGKRADGLAFEATINVLTGAVHGSIQGREVHDAADLKSLYDIASERFINDTFWLLMPLKMFDPGFYRAYDGTRSDTCGHTWDVLKITVEAVKGKPTATYWAWINRDTRMVEQWDIKLATMPADAPPVSVVFHDYRRIAGLLISTRREARGQNQVVRFDDLQILPETPKDSFK